MLAAIRGALNYASSNSANAKQIMARYSKNFLPIFFSIYTNVNENLSEANAPLAGSNGLHGGMQQGVRLAILETIRLYVSATPKELLASYIQVNILLYIFYLKQF